MLVGHAAFLDPPLGALVDTKVRASFVSRAAVGERAASVT